MAAAHVPSGSSFATKPSLAHVMIERAVNAGVPLGWVVADSVYGVGEIEMALKRVGKSCVLGVSSDHGFNSWDKPRRIGGTAAAIRHHANAQPDQNTTPKKRNA
jgi:SRSO17 transposase